MCCAGGGFEAVSCPHYLGEVVIYAGLVAALAGRRTTAWLMLLWVVRAAQRSAVRHARRCREKCTGWCTKFGKIGWGAALPSSYALCDRRHWAAWLPPALQVTNLSLAAGMTHRWYRQHFRTYPKHRRALFPLLY